jgi:LPS-assembly lipoprotein
MWWLKSIIVIVCIGCLQSCGFTPLYANHSKHSSSARERLLASIDIDPKKDRTGQVFVNTLEDSLNPRGLSANKRYQLKTSVETTQSSLAIQRDRTISRYQLIVTANYTLTDTSNGKIVRQGKLQRENGYDKTPSPYATFVSENMAIQNTVKALAQDLSFLLTSSVIGYDKTNPQTP